MSYQMNAGDMAQFLADLLQGYPKCTCDGALQKMIYERGADYKAEPDGWGSYPMKDFPTGRCATCKGRILEKKEAA